jgi:hypothetical protein
MHTALTDPPASPLGYVLQSCLAIQPQHPEDCPKQHPLDSDEPLVFQEWGSNSTSTLFCLLPLQVQFVPFQSGAFRSSRPTNGNYSIAPPLEVERHLSLAQVRTGVEGKAPIPELRMINRGSKWIRIVGHVACGGSGR